MKKILFVDHQTELGGGEIALIEIIKNLDREKFYPIVLIGDDGPLLDILRKEGVDVVINALPDCFRKLQRSPSRLPDLFSYLKAALNLPKVIKQTKDVIKRHQVDVVYINTIKSLVYASRAALSLNCKTIWHLHDCITKDFYPSWAIPGIIKMSRSIDNIICVSNIVREAYIKSGGDSGKAEVIYNGVDSNRFTPGIDTYDLKSEFKIVDKKIVSMVGRLEDWKGHEVFIKAAEIICKRRNDIVFLIVGAPLFGCQEHEEKLKNLVKELQLGNNILFLGFRDDPEKVISASDIIVHPSIKPEPFGRDVIEAMACAKTVIATRAGAIPEIIENNVNGILVECGNHISLAENIVKLLNDPQRIQALESNARKTAINTFNIENIINRISELF